MSALLFVCLPVNLSNGQHIILYAYFSRCLTAFMSVCLSVFLSLFVCLFDCLSVCLSVCLSACLSFNLFVCLFVFVCQERTNHLRTHTCDK